MPDGLAAILRRQRAAQHLGPCIRATGHLASLVGIGKGCSHRVLETCSEEMAKTFFWCDFFL